LAAKIGRRFGFAPRSITFDLDAKDSSVWAGQTIDVLHHEIADFTGAPEQTTFQILSVSERENYRYEALEYTYAEALPEDEGGGDPDVDLIVISGTRTNINIRDAYDGLFPAPDATTKVKVVIESSAIVGSTTSATSSLITGSWPAGALITLENRGFIVGKAGDGGEFGGDGTDGGDALELNYPITLNNLGVIGGGGGVVVALRLQMMALQMPVQTVVVAQASNLAQSAFHRLAAADLALLIQALELSNSVEMAGL